MKMRYDTTFSLPTLHRDSIGFERMLNELTSQFNGSPSNGYPPYNIIRHDEDSYEIALAVAGFTMDQLSVTQEKNQLRIEGHRSADEHSEDEKTKYLYKGIAGRNFKREFTLAEHVEVREAKLELGMLHVFLVRVVPESLQPRQIQIQSSETNSN